MAVWLAPGPTVLHWQCSALGLIKIIAIIKSIYGLYFFCTRKAICSQARVLLIALRCSIVCFGMYAKQLPTFK